MRLKELTPEQIETARMHVKRLLYRRTQRSLGRPAAKKRSNTMWWNLAWLLAGIVLGYGFRAWRGGGM